MKRVISLFVIMVIMCVFSVTSFAFETVQIQPEKYFDGKTLSAYCNTFVSPELKASACYAINLDTGTVVFEKNSTKEVFPASTVKLMTAIVAYENIPDLETKITVSNSVVRNARGTNMALKEGEIFTARELLYGLLVRGANDAALALAEHVAGSEKDFCVLMNNKAKQLGAQSTVFENVTGFHTPGSITTARDVAIISTHLYYNHELFEMTDTARYVVEPTKYTNEKRTLLNRNRLISRIFEDNYYYSGAHGMSVGSTPEGGVCAVSTVTSKENLTYLCVVMNSTETEKVNYACTDMVALFDYCVQNFSLQSVASTKDLVCEIPVKLAPDTDHVALFPQSDVVALLPNDLNYIKDVTIEKRLFNEYAKAPVNPSDVFGEIVIKYKDNAVVGRTGLVSTSSVDRSNVLYMLSRIESLVSGVWFKVFGITAVLLFLIYFALTVVFKVRRSKYYGRRR